MKHTLAFILVFAGVGVCHAERSLFVKGPSVSHVDDAEVSTACIVGRRMPSDSIFAPSRYKAIGEQELFDLMPFGDEIRGRAHPNLKISTLRPDSRNLIMMFDFDSLSFGRCMHVVSFPPITDGRYGIRPTTVDHGSGGNLSRAAARSYRDLFAQCENPVRKVREEYCTVFFSEGDFLVTSTQGAEVPHLIELAVKARVAAFEVYSDDRTYRVELVGRILFVNGKRAAFGK